MLLEDDGCCASAHTEGALVWGLIRGGSRSSRRGLTEGLEEAVQQAVHERIVQGDGEQHRLLHQQQERQRDRLADEDLQVELDGVSGGEDEPVVRLEPKPPGFVLKDDVLVGLRDDEEVELCYPAPDVSQIAAGFSQIAAGQGITHKPDEGDENQVDPSCPSPAQVGRDDG